MNDKVKQLFDYMKQYVEEPNVPDYTGEYPPCWEITQEEVELILNYINLLQQENQQLKEQLQQREEVIEEAIKKCELEISASSSQYERRHKQQDLIYKVAHERILDILNKYKNEDKESK